MVPDLNLLRGVRAMSASTIKRARRVAPVHILRSDQFSASVLAEIFREADRMEYALDHHPGKLRSRFRGHTLVNTFYEPSTRTRLSFAFAASHLGLVVHGTENAKEFSSAIKGESDEHTAFVISSYRPSLLVVRHHSADGPAHMAAVSPVPVINAGAAAEQHPTQALLDLYTIRKKKGRINGLTVVIGGDLKHGRTARSLASMLSLYRPRRIIFVSPEQVRMGEDILVRLRQRGIAYEQTSDLHKALPQADVVYWTRVQKERMKKQEYQRIKDRFVIGLPEMQLMKKEAILMHPLPIDGEIRPEVRKDPRAWYFKQAENGLYIRMALIAMLLTGKLKLRS